MNGFLVNPNAMSIALHTCVFLSLQPQGPYYSTQSVADYFHFSVHHVAKVVQKLAKAGLLDTVRGGKGGVRLRKKSADIFVYDIYAVIEGEYESKRCGVCLIRVKDCNGYDCLLGKWMKRMHDDTIALLKKTNLPTLIASIERLQMGKKNDSAASET
jgi:Rrf2 family protein